MLDIPTILSIIMHAAVGLVSILALVTLTCPSLLPNFLFSDPDPASEIKKKNRKTRRNKGRKEPDTFVYGLVNTGNTCFLNSVLQALSSSTYLLKYVKESPIILKELDGTKLDFEPDDFPVTEALYAAFSVLTRLVEKPMAAYPTEVVNSLRNKMRITTYEQQDAQEFFQILSDSLNEEDNIIAQTCRYSPLLDVDLLRSLVRETQTESNRNINHKKTNEVLHTIRRDPLNGLLASRLSCVQCGYTNSCTLEECLLAYVTIESLQEVICRKCSLNATLSKAISLMKENKGSKNKNSEKGKKTKAKSKDQNSLIYQQVSELTEALKYDIERDLGKEIRIEKVVSQHCTKQVMFAKPPPVLCLHLNRSAYFPNGSVTKNMCHVKFPEILDLSPFCTTGHLVLGPQSPLSIPEHTNVPSSNLYRLQSVIVHYGSHSYGHFVTYRRKPLRHIDELDNCSNDEQARSSKIDLEIIFKSSSSEWFQVSDQSVLPADILDVLNSNPYMLLYELIPPPKELPTKKEQPIQKVEIPTGSKTPELNGVNGTNGLSTSSPSPSTSSSGPPTPQENFESDSDLLGVGAQLLMTSSSAQSSGSSNSTPLDLVPDINLVD